MGFSVISIINSLLSEYILISNTKSEVVDIMCFNYNALQDFSNFELLSRIYSIDSEESIEIANSLKYDKLISRVKMMLQISDDEYNYDSVKIANIFLDCYVKTYLEMTDIDEAIGITIDINEIILSLGVTNNY